MEKINIMTRKTTIHFGAYFSKHIKRAPRCLNSFAKSDCQKMETKGSGQDDKKQNKDVLCWRKSSLSHLSLLLWPSHYCSSCAFVLVSSCFTATSTSLGLFLSPPCPSVHWALKSQLWRVKDVLFSSSVTHTLTHTHMLTQSQSKRVCSPVSVWPCELAGSPSVNEISWMTHIPLRGYTCSFFHKCL